MQLELYLLSLSRLGFVSVPAVRIPVEFEEHSQISSLFDLALADFGIELDKIDFGLGNHLAVLRTGQSDVAEFAFVVG